MNCVFAPVTDDYAQAIVAQWKYPGEYSIYDCAYGPTTCWIRLHGASASSPS